MRTLFKGLQFPELMMVSPRAVHLLKRGREGWKVHMQYLFQLLATQKLLIPSIYYVFNSSEMAPHWLAINTLNTVILHQGIYVTPYYAEQTIYSLLGPIQICLRGELGQICREESRGTPHG